MTYHMSPERKEQKRRQREAREQGQKAAPKHGGVCGGPILPAGTGRPVLRRPHPAPAHVWCERCGMDWLEQSTESLAAIVDAWERYGTVWLDAAKERGLIEPTEGASR